MPTPLLHARVRAALLLGVLIVASAALGGVAARSGGIPDRARTGCGAASGCHAQAAAPAVTSALEGLPEAYEPDRGYVLTVRIDGATPAVAIAQNQGGFALEATAGTLSNEPQGAEVQIMQGNATHTQAGNDRREWLVGWVAPLAGAGPVTFYLAVNAVNGNTLNDPLDEWNIASFTVREGASAGGPPPGDGGNASAPRDETPDAPAPGPEDEGGDGVPGPALPLALAAIAAAALRRRAKARSP